MFRPGPTSLKPLAIVVVFVAQIQGTRAVGDRVLHNAVQRRLLRVAIPPASCLRPDGCLTRFQASRISGVKVA